MKTGDKVRVYPHGDPEKAAEATIAILSSNGCSIAVGFMDKPPFAVGFDGDPLSMAVHPEFGIILFARREILNGAPGGPWIEIFGGGHYEIEEVHGQL